VSIRVKLVTKESVSNFGVTAGNTTHVKIKYGIVAVAQIPRILANEYWFSSS
jgi:hypothetical protein